ncbi:tetratricopeptide repeat protein [Undibacterium sp. JH2W]|uniref:tetratricopeptide repeat protein n=1 Tax=Undibacterium sp. JH2W TaxID=3413037 RepID=UPI003BF3540A
MAADLSLIDPNLRGLLTQLLEVIGQFNVGTMYSTGEGVPKDDVQAVSWYRKAAEQGHAQAQSNLGLMYANGRGVQQDQELAYFWHLLARAGGNEDAQKNIDMLEKKLTAQQVSKIQTDVSARKVLK